MIRLGLDILGTLAQDPSSRRGTARREFLALHLAISVTDVFFFNVRSDSVLYPQNFFEQIKQWTNVLGISSTPTSNLTNTPVANYWCATFGNGQLQANFANGVGHEIWYREGDVLDFFGLSSLTPAPGPGGEGPGPTLPPVAQWGQVSSDLPGRGGLAC